jgi:hypothetical protein
MWNSKSCPEGIPRTRKGATTANAVRTKINRGRAEGVTDWADREGMLEDWE